jgi:hypothetical protein
MVVRVFILRKSVVDLCLTTADLIFLQNIKQIRILADILQTSHMF